MFWVEKMDNLAEKIPADVPLSYDAAVDLARSTPLEELVGTAAGLRDHFSGRRIDSCSILNARSGLCSEDCKWCSQSRFSHTRAEVYPLVPKARALEAARYNEERGIGRFSLVTSGRAVTGGDFERICEIYSDLRAKTKVRLCASLGLLTREQMRRLKEAGVERYHCNLESAPSFFPSLCTTHTTEDKLQTLREARAAGLDLCSGGIIGMGETMEQRIELAVILRDAGVKSIPVNFLNPIEGTPLEGTPPLDDDELVASVAMFRIINPDADIRMAGGRVLYRHLHKPLLGAGVSAAIMGDMLTTTGSDIAADRRMFEECGFTMRGIGE